MAAPVVIIDDNDDEFDWEAAVQQIDDACQKTRETASFPSSSSLQPPIYPPSSRAEISNEACGQLNGLHKKNRQSTLDQFINRGLNSNLNGRIDKGKELEVEAEIGVDVNGCCVDIDPEAAKTWIYPENVPLREYQLSISKKALFSNTMVALPTGLGKTLIAAVVMYNYFRWFPEGKIVFTAPSRPLVIQQIEACHNIVGIPQEWTIDMTGQTSPAKRACLWKEKRVFFVTPQVFEKDIKSGTCLVQNLVCLVIDEAHRATGNYSYCVAVRELMDVPVQLRILALTATPGSKQQAIQQVIDKLQISTLEYRSESDPDVAPYVHNRKLDLMEVPLGQDAVDVSNLLLDIIRPMAARLFALGVLPNRDFQTLSPCDLLTSREKFRQAPPPNLHQKNFGEIEGGFRALLSLYHVRKLLSSHGIRPAYEMLEDKFKQGPMSNNEIIHQLKVAMRRSMSNGAPSPKLSKLLEVLVDHFKNNDPESSRVIIFSNFRGSVRDIMDALSNLGNIVRPAEFIGQSAGKTLKGQTQKAQQAVLEKFRKGAYNIIVATCIGEEGLDIMEVDLVICFDANISPLRMTQRMGRTGRKHDGRVVIIVCEGSELKGYIRKQATSKAVKKHMQNGGMNSFVFHPSPRMVPHIYRPEQKCLQLSIPEYVRRGKEVKGDASPLLRLEEKLTAAETCTLARYFSNKDNTWKPSLIAYPHFQGLPSKVQLVKHSSRTLMLIDTMQHLQGESCTWNNLSSDVKFQNSPDHCAEVRGLDKVNTYEEEHVEASNAELFSFTANPEKALGTKNPSSDTSFEAGVYVEAISVAEVLNAMSPPHDTSERKVTSQCHHLFLFSSQIASLDSDGKVLVAPIPILDVKELLYSLNPIARDSILPHCSGQKAAANSLGVYGDAKELPKETSVFASLSLHVEPRFEHFEAILVSQSPTPKIYPVQKIREGNCLQERSNAIMYSSSEFLDLTNDDEEGEFDLSPRLTNFVKSGCVPESPIQGYKGGDMDDDEIIDMEPEVLITSHANDEEVVVISTPCTPMHKAATCSMNSEDFYEGAAKYRTPLANLTNSNCSKDWYLSSGEKSVGEKRSRKLKRLRKIGDTKSCNRLKENPAKFTNIEVPVRRMLDNGGLERVLDVRDLIQEEAEVSSEFEVSADEEDDQNDDTFEDSFIDDKVDPTMATQPQSSEVDMMGIYRRSLLSQSPIRRKTKQWSPVTPDSLASITSNSSPTTPQTSTILTSSSSRRISVCSKLEKITEEASTSGTTSPQYSKKRKFSCGEHNAISINLEKEFSSLHGDGAKPNDGDGKFDMNDDEFYENLDFDALEEEAAKLLEEKTSVSSARKIQPSFDDFDIPAFDLGF